MKQTILAASLAALSVTSAFGALVQCSPSQGTLVVGGVLQSPAVFTCSPDAGANNIAGDGRNVVSVQLTISITSGQSSGTLKNTIHTALTTMSNSASLNNVSPNPVQLSFTSSAGSGNGSASTGDLTALSTPVAAVDEFAAFTVTLSPSVFGSNPLPAGASAAVFYDAVAVSPVPEPGSMALLGCVLVAAGWVRRKK